MAGSAKPRPAPATGPYTYTVSLLAAHNVTASFGLTVAESVPPIPKAPDGTSLWANSVTFTWYPVTTAPTGFALAGNIMPRSLSRRVRRP